MKKLLLGSSAFLALAGAVVLAQGPALAAPPDDLDREKAQLRKENADLRDLLRMHDENKALRRRLGQQGVEAPAPLPVAQSPRLGGSSSGEALRAEPAARGAKPSVFESYAADLPVKAAPVRAAVYNWTGFYLGGNIGYSVGSDRARASISAGLTDLSGADSVVAPVGAIGGVQLGYNWQGGPNWLVGFEADFQGSGQKGTSCTLLCVTSSGQQETFTVQHKLDYFGTVRGRVGVVSNNALFYVTGGGAYGRVDQTLGAVVNTGPPLVFSTAVSSAENKFGFVVGAGVEAALGGNWTGKIEYLYMDLGSTTTSGLIPGPITFTASSTIHDNIIRGGLNYRLGPPSAPLTAYDAMAAVPAPSSIYSWTGLYVGGNVGYGFGNDLVAQTISSVSIVGTTEPNTHLTPKGVVGGVQLGYNWQGGRNWLVGFEADLQGSAQTDTGCAPLACITAAAGTGFITVQHQLDYFGTLRGRLGAINDNVLYYVTGGAAFGHVKQTVTENVSTTAVPLFGTGSSTADMIGWVIGGGIEAALWGGWTAKAEYLYMDLGSLATSADFSQPGNPGTVTTNSTVRDHIARIGANYRLN
jgi:outer membrane immunogenic protein